MAGNAYVDSSALLKLALPDADTPALEADLSDRDGLLSSRLTAIECGRTLVREARRKPLYTLEDLLEGLVLLEITPAIGERASSVAPPVLRTLDAIHLATALSLDDPSLEIITYDRRLADAARAQGLTVVQPGRPPQA